jgi:aspartate/methionine/tyrosine aminotransferase
MSALTDLPVIRPHGGWSLLIDTEQLGLAPSEASRRLLERGEVAATPMDNWGPSGSRYLRLVFANEPIERLADIRARIRQSWDI